MHGADARAHQQRTAGQGVQPQPGPGRDLQRQPRHRHRGHPGQQGLGQAVAQRDRQRERQHADEVHGPDARAHHQRAAQLPQQGQRPGGRAQPARQVQRHKGGQRRDHERQQHTPEVVGVGQHQRWVPAADRGAVRVAVEADTDVAVQPVARVNSRGPAQVSGRGGEPHPGCRPAGGRVERRRPNQSADIKPVVCAGAWVRPPAPPSGARPLPPAV